MGLLDSIFGGGDGKQGGGMSKMTLALMAILAYRTYQGKGRLADMLGRKPDDGTQPSGNAVPGHPAGDQALPRTAEAGGGGLGGGLGDLLGGLFGGGQQGGRPMGGPGAQGDGLGGLLQGGGSGGGLGGLLGGAAAGGLLSGGLGTLLDQLRKGGQGEAADSWVGKGENRRLAPQELEGALGRDTVQELADQTGKPYLDVLSELSQSLPDTVDKLTPEGRMPTEQEAGRWV